MFRRHQSATFSGVYLASYSHCNGPPLQEAAHLTDFFDYDSVNAFKIANPENKARLKLRPHPDRGCLAAGATAAAAIIGTQSLTAKLLATPDPQVALNDYRKKVCERLAPIRKASFESLPPPWFDNRFRVRDYTEEEAEDRRRASWMPYQTRLIAAIPPSE